MKKSNPKSKKLKWTSKKPLVIWLLVFSIIGGVTAYQSFTSESAIFGWSQTDWSGGDTEESASHRDDQTGWSEYQSKDENLDTSTPGEISSRSNVQINTDSSNEDFNQGENENIKVENDEFSLSLVGTHDIFKDGSALATYQLDGDTTDLGGNYNWSWSGTEQYSTGRFDQSANFDGSSSIPFNQGTFGAPEDVFSVSGWIKPSTASEMIMIKFGGRSNGFGIGTLSDGYPAVGFRGDVDGNISHPEDVTNSWTHVVAVHDPSRPIVEFYVNGNYVGSEDTSFADGTNQDGIAEGDQSPLTGTEGPYYFQGQIDQIRIFNRVLTADEVDVLYNE